MLRASPSAEPELRPSYLWDKKIKSILWPPYLKIAKIYFEEIIIRQCRNFFMPIFSANKPSFFNCNLYRKKNAYMLYRKAAKIKFYHQIMIENNFSVGSNHFSTTAKKPCHIGKWRKISFRSAPNKSLQVNVSSIVLYFMADRWTLL